MDPNFENCQCEDDHVVELRLVAATLNRLSSRTYRAKGWQTKLVDFFDREFQTSAPLPRKQHQQKVRAVEKWLAGDILNDAETKRIDDIRKTWGRVKQKLQGFEKFKAKFDKVLAMDEFIARVL